METCHNLMYHNIVYHQNAPSLLATSFKMSSCPKAKRIWYPLQNPYALQKLYQQQQPHGCKTVYPVRDTTVPTYSINSSRVAPLYHPYMAASNGGITSRYASPGTYELFSGTRRNIRVSPIKFSCMNSGSVGE